MAQGGEVGGGLWDDVVIEFELDATPVFHCMEFSVTQMRYFQFIPSSTYFSHLNITQFIMSNPYFDIEYTSSGGLTLATRRGVFNIKVGVGHDELGDVEVREVCRARVQQCVQADAQKCPTWTIQ
jgi:hypothetical protein